MPIPTLNKNENKPKFISRCIKWMHENNEFNGNKKQQVAVCYSKWDNMNENKLYLKYLNERDSISVKELQSKFDKVKLSNKDGEIFEWLVRMIDKIFGSRPVSKDDIIKMLPIRFKKEHGENNILRIINLFY